VGAVTDELTRPLGVDRPEPAPSALKAVGIKVAAAIVTVAALGFVGVSLWLGDQNGGVPHVSVPIVVRTEPAPKPPQDAAEAPQPKTPNPDAQAALPGDRRSAEQVETASGVAVTRPTGTSAPASVIVQVPDDTGRGLKAAPDPRLVERSRYGSLPKIGPDGARPSIVYARPAGSLPGGAKPVSRIALVIGGLGISDAATADAIDKLPAPITLAFAPYGNTAALQAARAREAGHEIMLQVPMEPFDYPDSDPGPHTLTVGARPAENIEHLHWALGRFTGFIGVMNYMGGKLTADANAVTPVLRDIGGRGLVVLDDGSSSRSRLTELAGEGIGARADVVLDAVPRGADIDRALQALEANAAARGFAIGSASALPMSLERIGAWTRTLEARGILLVPVSAAFGTGSRKAVERPVP
jgi:polysaccharide deacetylase 2 family uncharacterized protein YibQ